MKSFQLTITKSDRQILLPAFVGIACLSAFATGVSAQDSSSPVADLVAESEQIDGVYDAIIPVAVGSIVFSIGAMMIKRVAFA